METSALKINPARALKDLGRHMLVDGYDIVADLSKSRGARIYDAKRDTRYLDFFTCFATCPLGYNHPVVSSPEAVDRLGRAAINKPSNSDLYSWEMLEFVETFARIAKRDFFKYAFFIEGGALAVENCLKAAFDWKVRKNLAKGVGEKGYKVIHFRDAFHGRSGYTLSLTNTDPGKTDYFLKFDWPRIINPKCTFPLEGDNLQLVERVEAEALQQIEAAIDQDPDDVAAIILEPIQSEGGDHHFRPQFHQAIRRICDERDVLLVYDEVQTGFGGSGKFWCFEHFGIRPDLLAFGKKSQVCGALAGERLDEVADNVFHVSSRINSTWGGNLVDMVRCSMYLRIYEEEKILDQVRHSGDFLIRQLEEIQQEFPHLVSNARGQGLLCAFDLPSSELRRRLRLKLFDRRLLILGSGTHSIRFRTALNIPMGDLEEGLAIIRETLKEL